MSLRDVLGRGELVVAPGVFDGLSARLAERHGFAALYLTGYGASASLLGQPDAGFLTREHIVDRLRTIAAVTRAPLIADADTGFGDAAEVAITVRAYEAAGAAAIQLEDQVFPKRCGHTPGREVIALGEAVDKIRAAVDARRDAGFAIVARTDARTGHGLAAAIDRAGAFAEAGADLLFVESPESEDELRQIARALPGTRLVANMVEGGRTPFLPPAALADMGYALAIYPLFALSAAAAAIDGALATLRTGATGGPLRMPFAELNRAVGFEALWEADATLRGRFS